jgi:hypothetical protein
MAESVDAADLKSAGRKTVGVQVPLPPSLKGLAAPRFFCGDDTGAPWGAGPLIVVEPNQLSELMDRGRIHHPLLAGCPWLLPTHQRFRAAANCLELDEAEGVNHQELELLPLGELPLALSFCPKAPVCLALPADWQEHPVLRHTAREVGRMGAAQQLEG